MSPSDIATVIVGVVSVAGIGIALLAARRVQRRRAHREHIESITRPPYAGRLCWGCEQVIPFGQKHYCAGRTRSGL